MLLGVCRVALMRAVSLSVEVWQLALIHAGHLGHLRGNDVQSAFQCADPSIHAADLHGQ